MSAPRFYVIVPLAHAKGELVKDHVAFALLAWLKTYCRWETYQTTWAGKMIDVEPGQVIETQRQMAEALGVDRTKIRRALSRLVADGFVASTTLGTGERKDGLLITVADFAEAAARRRAAHGSAHEIEAEPIEMLVDSSPPFADLTHDLTPLLKGVTKRESPYNPSPLPPSEPPVEPGGGDDERAELLKGRAPDPLLREAVRVALGAPLPSPSIAAEFDSLWALAPPTYSREALIDEARWIAAQPLLERATSINRVWHVSAARQAVAKRQAALEQNLIEALRCGLDPARLAAECEVGAGRNEARYRAHVLATAQRLAPEAPERGRL